MHFAIDSRIIRNRGLGLDEFLGLLLIKHCYNPKTLFENLTNKGAIVPDGKVDGVYYLTEACDEFLNDTLCAMNKDCPRGDQVEYLAEALIKLFPKGAKKSSDSPRGTPWRGNKKDIADRLRKFFDKYGKYSFEDIIDATKRYVESFEGNYTYMRVLKYFIWKEEKQYDEFGVYKVSPSSDLADFLENKEAGNEERFVLGELR